MGLLDGLLGQSGVSSTGGGTVYDPTQDNWEIRFDTEGNAYQSRVEAPLAQGHTTARQEVSTQRFDVPEEPSLLNYGDNYYSGEQFTPQNVAPKAQPTPDLMNQPGVNRVPQEEHDRFNAIHAPSSRETRYDGQGNVYQADPRTPLIEGHRKASSFNIPTPEPTEYLGPIGQSYSQGQGQQIPEGAYGSLGDNQTWSRQQAPTTSLRPRDAVESVAQDNRGSIAPWLPEQTNFDDARNLMSSYQGGERIAQRDTGTFKDLTPNVDPSKAMEMMAMFKKEGKALTDLQFEKAMGSFGMSDILEEHRSTMNLSDRDSFGNIIPDANAYEQGVDQALDKANRFQWDSSAKEANISRLGYDPMTEMNALNGTTPNVIPEPEVKPTFTPNPNATKFWNENAETNFNINQGIDTAKQFGSDAIDTVGDVLGPLATDIYGNIKDSASDAWETMKRGDEVLANNVLNRGTEDVLSAIPGAYSRGVGNAVKLGKTVGNVALGEEYFDENDGEILTPSKPNYNYPMLGEGVEVAGSYLGGATAGVKLLGQAPNLVKYVGAIFGGTATTDPTEGNLSTMIQDTEYRNAFTEYLMADTNDESSSLEKLKTYGKNFLEEGLLGAPFDAAIVGYQAIKNNPNLKAKILEELGDIANKAETMAGKIPGVETEQTLRKSMVKPGVDARTQIDELGFYSESENVVNKLKQETNHPDHIRQFMQKNGVTVDEMKETGILDYLSNAKTKDERVTKTGLLNHISKNKTQLDETQHLGSSDAGGDQLNETQLDDPAWYEGADGGNVTVLDDTDYIYNRAEDIKYELNSSDEFEMNRLFEHLHKSDPEKYPKTIDMYIDDAKIKQRELDRVLHEDSANMVENVNKYINDNNLSVEDSSYYSKEQSLKKLEKSFEQDLIELQNKRGTTDGYVDDWAGQIGKKIDDGDIDDLDFDIDDITYDIAEADYAENPFYEWNTGTDGHNFTATGNEDIGITIRDPDGDYLNGGQPVYSINEANVQIREYAYDNDIGYGTDSQTKYSDFTQKGLDVNTYREIPITSKSLSGEDYRGGHFDEDNVVGHLRVSDRTDIDGNKVLFIEELQSDWHQSGRKGGYSTKENERKIMKLGTEADNLKREYAVAKENNPGFNDVTPRILKRIDEIEKEKLALMGTVPDAPLKNDKWQEMAFKRAMKIASEGDYDRVAWTNSQQQVGLYSERYRELYENMYDKKLPGFAKKFAKQNQSNTGKTKIEFTDFSTKYGGDKVPNPTEINYIDITPGLKANVNKGQSMYGATSVAKPNKAAVAIPTGGLLAGGAESQAEDEIPMNGVLDGVKKPKVVRNVRSNNPGNIKDFGIKWNGMTGTESGGTVAEGSFVVFDKPENGIRALTRDLTNKRKRGLDTITKILNKYAPNGKENDTKSYIKDVARDVGISATTKLSDENMYKMIKAITKHEGGKDSLEHFTDAIIKKGMKSAYKNRYQKFNSNTPSQKQINRWRKQDNWTGSEADYVDHILKYNNNPPTSIK